MKNVEHDLQALNVFYIKFCKSVMWFYFYIIAF